MKKFEYVIFALVGFILCLQHYTCKQEIARLNNQHSQQMEQLAEQYNLAIADTNTACDLQVAEILNQF